MSSSSSKPRAAPFTGRGDRDSFSGAPGTAQPSEVVAVRGRAWSFRSAGAAHAAAGVLGGAGGWELIICGYLTTASPR
ncbi:hypothetical protein [Ferrimicrobium sp.]|uniref:hypothetical protein n=1 Tax=Ferrimicrobium sp. TaxID=2926050 RepID=UPI00260BF770|nr:hypothetical protein [Ferrimicrobium sp.]